MSTETTTTSTSTAASRPTLLVRLADWSYRRRRRVLVLWVALLVATVFAAGAFGGDYNFTFSTPGSDSQKAQDLLERGFRARAGDDVDVVFQTRQGTTVDDPAVRAAIVDKDNAPCWQPAALADVSDAEVERHFAPLGSDELSLP